MTTTETPRVVALPDALPRRATNLDVSHAELPGTTKAEEGWRVEYAPPVRGACSTNIGARIMHVPDEMGYTAAAVRAHEMTHAAFSPVDDAATLAPEFGVSVEALAAAEEYRVTMLAAYAGVSMDHLTDETEKSTARLVALKKDYRAALLLTTQVWGTNAAPVVTRAINKNAPTEWKKPLAEYRRYLRDMATYHNWRAKRMGEYETTGGKKVPEGFIVAVNVARRIDNMVNSDPTPTRAESEMKAANQRAKAQHDAREQANDKASRKFVRHPEHSEKGSPYEDVRLMVSTLDGKHIGKIAQKRTPAQTGKKPRRMSRLLTDPQRRVFDRKTRTNGGVVVIDMSGSMRLDSDDIDRMVEAAGGATVIGYSNIGSDRANVWVIADNGNRATAYPEYGSGNDCDAPALRFAATMRRNKREPFIWVSDGRAYHGGNSFSERAVKEIRDIINRHGITSVRDADEAVRELQRCARGNTPKKGMHPFITAMLNDYARR